MKFTPTPISCTVPVGGHFTPMDGREGDNAGARCLYARLYNEGIEPASNSSFAGGVNTSKYHIDQFAFRFFLKRGYLPPLAG